MLLQDLHDRHVCNSLLVAESEEDIWKTESVYRKRLNASDGESEERADASAGSLTLLVVWIKQVFYPVFTCSYRLK